MRIINKTSVAIMVVNHSKIIPPQQEANFWEGDVHNLYVVNSKIGGCRIVSQYDKDNQKKLYIEFQDLTSRITAKLTETPIKCKSINETYVEIIEF